MESIKQNISIFVINLERSIDRRTYMQNQLNKFNVKYQFFSAVDGKEKKDLYDEKKAIKRYRHPFVDGEIGCSLSHIGVYKKMIEKNISEALILEDDVLLHKNFFNVIFQRKKWAPNDYDILNFF